MLLEFFKPSLECHHVPGRVSILGVIILCDLDDNVHHIRHAAGAFRTSVELAIDLCRHHELPRICLEQVQDDVLDLLGGDHIALADEHSGGRKVFSTGGNKRPPYLNVNIINCRVPGAAFGQAGACARTGR